MDCIAWGCKQLDSATRLSNYHFHCHLWASLVDEVVRNPPTVLETWVQSLDGKDPLEKGVAALSSILAWEILWTEEADRLQSMGLQRAGQDSVTSTFCYLHIFFGELSIHFFCSFSYC